MMCYTNFNSLFPS